MGVNRVLKRGKSRIEVRKRWPDGTTFRRFMPNMTVAKRLWNEIEVAIARGTWRELKEQLAGTKKDPSDFTVEEFAKIYLEDYCRHHNRRPDFKEQALVSINRILGNIKLRDFQRLHADQFVATRSKDVVPATVNRGLAVLKHMLNFAVKRGYLESNPLVGFEKLPEEEIPLRIMTLEDERKLVLSVAASNHVIGAYVAILGETGLRKSEGLRIEWSHIDWERKMLTVPKSKTGEPRYIPLSEYAIQWLQGLQRWAKSPWVFTWANGKPVRDPRESFNKGRDLAGLNWVRGFHDLRHFRATQWLMHGVDIYTVKSYLGHKRIETTQRYLHFVPSHAERSVRAAQAAEQEELEQLDRSQGAKMSEAQVQVGDIWETPANLT
ncbi:site-specific integrase [Acidobacteria bacterium AH-259-L09]|nr:site-specific integrase [Acidobacteria bacterium AH-259-L09]